MNDRRDDGLHPAITHPSLRLRDARDAHIVMEAVRLHVLPLIKRRLVANERERISAGNVFVWEEADDDGGLLRWTDGRRWSQSRMRGDYLFYEEKVETTQEERDAKAARRATRISDPEAPLPAAVRRKDRPSKPNGLTKQTYSATVYQPGQSLPLKWHLVAYYSGNDYTRLPTVDQYEYLRRVKVPEGIFFSSKSVPPRSDQFSDMDRYSGSLSPVPGTLQPYATSQSPPGTSSHSARIVLPPLASIHGHPPHHNSNSAHASSSYNHVSAEDQRVLNKFRLSL